MATKPTLFDRIRYGQIHSYDGMANDELKKSIGRAVPFVIDDDALRATMALRGDLLQSKRIKLPDVARVPFEHTWVEYNPRVKVPTYDPKMTSRKVGHFIVREEIGASVMTFELGPEGDDTTFANPYVFRWATDPDTIAPCIHIIGADFRRKFSPVTADMMRASLLTGTTWMPAWKDRFGVDLVQPGATQEDEDLFLNETVVLSAWHLTVLQENASIGSLLMTLLALLAWCPTEKVRHKPDGRWIHKGTTRPYMEHTVVKIRIPIRKVYQSIERGQSQIKRRRHRCREHLRVYHAGKPNQKIIVIAEHMRGDASLGFVNQDYEVTS